MPILDRNVEKREDLIAGGEDGNVTISLSHKITRNPVFSEPIASYLNRNSIHPTGTHVNQQFGTSREQRAEGISAHGPDLLMPENCHRELAWLIDELNAKVLRKFACREDKFFQVLRSALVRAFYPAQGDFAVRHDVHDVRYARRPTSQQLVRVEECVL